MKHVRSILFLWLTAIILATGSAAAELPGRVRARATPAVRFADVNAPHIEVRDLTRPAGGSDTAAPQRGRLSALPVEGATVHNVYVIPTPQGAVMKAQSRMTGNNPLVMSADAYRSAAPPPAPPAQAAPDVGKIVVRVYPEQGRVELQFHDRSEWFELKLHSGAAPPDQAQLKRAVDDAIMAMSSQHLRPESFVQAADGHFSIHAGDHEILVMTRDHISMNLHDACEIEVALIETEQPASRRIHEHERASVAARQAAQTPKEM